MSTSTKPAPQWGAGNQYDVGDVVVYEGYYYKVIQAHTSQDDWKPTVTPALWGQQGEVGAYFPAEERKPLQEAHEAVVNAPHETSVSHQLVAGAAAFEAARAWEHHQEKNGKPVEHAHVKEFGAALIGAFVDRIAETKGRDAFDSFKAKREAQEKFDSQIPQKY